MTRTTINFLSWQKEAIQLIKNSDTPSLEVQILLSEVLGKSREWVISHPEQELTDEQLRTLDPLLCRLSNGEPLAYLVGKKAFWGLEFFVSKDVLIPRPETELLVEETIKWLQENPAKRTVIDVGTGSGAIAISLADSFQDLVITAIDISQSALDVAKRNCSQFQLDIQITFKQNNLLDNLELNADVIVANLPYIPTPTLDSLTQLRFEPRLALDGGNDGTKLINKLLDQSVVILKPGGILLLEIESTISDLVIDHARKVFPDAKIDLIFDFAYLPRIVKIHR